LANGRLKAGEGGRPLLTAKTRAPIHKIGPGQEQNFKKQDNLDVKKILAPQKTPRNG
jgi:hypothetical protein